jgi:hypothetical protein
LCDGDDGVRIGAGRDVMGGGGVGELVMTPAAVPDGCGSSRSENRFESVIRFFSLGLTI